ncbi:hypothetical protein PMZ80_004498 [Knufia obscura]|uniref:Uncharacterized protein n=2 Tax=Knufia TaxID=430999 RepID=A0AAN8EBP4_9EURO|nr:hypothetical protein PMZ80_004498 [Knufia obscura]KAK5951624.1 hypothetical protein OHC33_007303 [Knufia fluminis]
MSGSKEAVEKAQARAQEAAKSDTEHPEAGGDLHESAQQVGTEHSAAHAEGSGMKQAAEKKQSESKETVGDKAGNAKDQVEGVGASSS